MRQLLQVQELYRGIFQDMYKQGDQPSLPAMEDQVIAVCISFREMRIRMSGDPEEEPEENDITAAIEFLDYLDTQNMEVRYKSGGRSNNRRNRPGRGPASAPERKRRW